MSKSQSQIFSQLQFFPYIAYVQKVKRIIFILCEKRFCKLFENLDTFLKNNNKKINNFREL